MEAYSFCRTAEDPERVPLTNLPVRALMAPPGIPDFFSRARVVAPGTHRVVGRAWAGAVDLDRVEFSSDGGKTWSDTRLSSKNGPFGWAAWEIDWHVDAEGTYVLLCRGFDAKGRSQDDPNDEQFNWTAMGDTQPQMVYVKVDKAIEDDGGSIDCLVEQRAARTSLNTDTDHGPALPQHLVNALYRSPGSQ